MILTTMFKIPAIEYPDGVGLPLPRHHSDGAAGIDLYAAADVSVPSTGGFVSVHTGIGIAIPDGYVGLVKPRSGLARKAGIVPLEGVIDSDYRGEVVVLLHDIEPRPGVLPYQIKRGERIAQLLLMPVERVVLFRVDQLPMTARASGGFGSTGTGRGHDGPLETPIQLIGGGVA